MAAAADPPGAGCRGSRSGRDNAHRGQGQIRRSRIPTGRVDHRRVDAAGVHRAMASPAVKAVTWRWAWLLGSRCPRMDLRVDNRQRRRLARWHRAALKCFAAGRMGGRPMAGDIGAAGDPHLRRAGDVIEETLQPMARAGWPISRKCRPRTSSAGCARPRRGENRNRRA